MLHATLLFPCFLDVFPFILVFPFLAVSASLGRRQGVPKREEKRGRELEENENVCEQRPSNLPASCYAVAGSPSHLLGRSKVIVVDALRNFNVTRKSKKNVKCSASVFYLTDLVISSLITIDSMRFAE